MNFEIQPIQQDDIRWITHFLTEEWGSPEIVVHGKKYQADDLPGFIAFFEKKPVGLITYTIEKEICEIISLNSKKEGIGIGTALIEEVKKIAKEKECKKITAITTNDNLKAFAYYQRRGFRVSKIYSNALEESRKLKPQIPFVGENNIPLRDEIELECIL